MGEPADQAMSQKSNLGAQCIFNLYFVYNNLLYSWHGGADGPGGPGETDVG